MIFWKKLMTVAALSTMLAVIYAGFAFAAVSPQEAAQLGGPVLTAFGAEKAGNKDGTIPPYTGGLTKAPANYKMGSGIRPDPFAAESPLFSISAQNMDQYADKLGEGVKALMKKYPSFHIDVYKTHRTIAYPKWVLDHTAQNAIKAITTDGGLSLKGAFAGVAFPIPKTGYEVMWNHLTRFEGLAQEWILNPYSVDYSGKASLVSTFRAWQQFDFYNLKVKEADRDSCFYYMVKVEYLAPPRINGEWQMLKDPLNIYKTKRTAYQYLPGLRRVKLAPELDHDTPNLNGGGVETFDDLWIFTGSMERYNWKLIGKKEIYVPYNSYKSNLATVAQFFHPNHPNPDMVRWELHRVWVVEATLMPGKRHVYHKRRIYIDEDSWSAVLDERYDAHGKLWKTGWTFITPAYEYPTPLTTGHFNCDLVTSNYVVNPWIGKADTGQGFAILMDKPFSERFWGPQSMGGVGIR